MSLPRSPFTLPTVKSGNGRITLSLLSPGRPTLATFEYQYPLKLIAPDPHESPSGHSITLVFLLTYGGGLVAGDRIDLSISIAAHARLAMVTQGSTKIFKAPSPDVLSGQRLEVEIQQGGALVYLPDPVQPFKESCYEQRQTFRVAAGGKSGLCMLDWVSEGRTARGEKWDFWLWKGKNEVRELAVNSDGSSMEGRLLLRDALTLDNESTSQVHGLIDKTADMGVFGTLIIYGEVFQSLKEHFEREFTALPRIGAKQWSTDGPASSTHKPPREAWREKRIAHETSSGLLWTAASLRGFVVVKFGSRQVEGSRHWLADMIREEGSLGANFGPQALLCLQ
ncbi:MAG: hypothetical protein Q9160_002345 [Pyrenula sp. 1 TL-2023]